MSERRVFNVDLEPLTMAMLLILAGMVAGSYFLARGLQDRSPGAFLVLGGLLPLGLGLLFVVLTLTILWFAHWMSERRDRIEAERFRMNVVENQGVLEAGFKAQGQAIKTQAAMNAMLLRQARETQRMLPSPEGDAMDAPHISFDEAIFSELDDEEME